MARSALPYSALWESLFLTTTKGRSSLSARVQGRTEYREQEFSEESSDAAAPEFKKLSFDEHSITTQAFSAVRYYLGEEVPETLTGSVKVTGADGDRKHAVEFVIVADLPLRAALLEATPTLLTLGRPRREQIATSRNAIATTIQALESSNGNGVMDLLRRCAKNLMAGIVEGHGEAKREVMRRLLGREPTKDEQEELLPSSGGDPEEDINDFLWAVISLPEFELIT